MDTGYRMEMLEKCDHWTYDPEVRVLRFVGDGHQGYEVDPEAPCSGALTAGQVLGCIAHVAAKTWATPVVVGELVVALDAVLDIRSLGFSGSPHPLWMA